MASTFDPHQYPKRSRLEKWRKEIAEMRAHNWPCAKIVRWLLEYHGLVITDEAVRQYCIRRGISKGAKNLPASVSPGSPKPRRNAVGPTQKAPKGRASKIFEYDDSVPIDRWGHSQNEGGKQ